MKRKKLSLFLPAVLILTSFLGLIGCSEDPENANPNQQQPTVEKPKNEAPKNETPKQETPTAPATVVKNGDSLVPNPMIFLY